MQSDSQSTDCRVVLVEPGSRKILVHEFLDSYHLPRIWITNGARPAEQLQEAVLANWGLKAFLVDFLIDDAVTGVCVVAEVHGKTLSSCFRPVTLNHLPPSQLTVTERQQLAKLMQRDARAIPFSIGWIDEALAWADSVAGRRCSSIQEMKQLNAGGGFALLTLPSEDGSRYWFKATGTPNTHELQVTACLSQLCPESLPKLVATNSEWNAWLTEDAGQSLAQLHSKEELVSAARAFAALQIKTSQHTEELLAAGAIDHRLSALRSYIDPVFTYLIDAMKRQTSVKAPPLPAARLLELADMIWDTTLALEALEIPDTLIHNDLNEGNILFNGERWSFIDWSEAAVGNPFLSLGHLLLLDPMNSDKLKSAYCQVWASYLSPVTIDRALVLTPLLAIFAYLYGRGDWLRETSKEGPSFDSCARSLARHMDRAAENSLLLETLCR